MSFVQNFLETLWTWILPSIFKIFLILLIAFFVQHLINLGASNLLRQSTRFKRGETLNQIINSTSKVIIILITAIMILHELGIDVRPIIASAGILSLAVSLGAQHVVKDVVNGFYILLEDQFGIGDKVKIGDVIGIVEKMNLRLTLLRDHNGNVHIIPNSEIKQITKINS